MKLQQRFGNLGWWIMENDLEQKLKILMGKYFCPSNANLKKI
jgi:hypothetical protein